MYLLDTDVLSLFFRRKGQQPYLEQRILAKPIEQLLISIISFDEAMNGIRALIDNLPSNEEGKKGCQLLRSTMKDYSTFEIFPYSSEAAAIFKSMAAATKRVGKDDCKIASIAIANGFTVITRNVEHYRAIPEVQFEDWTRKEIIRR